MRSALVKITYGIVENIVVADGTVDYPPRGYALIPLSDKDKVEIGDQWSETEKFIPKVKKPDKDEVGGGTKI